MQGRVQAMQNRDRENLLRTCRRKRESAGERDREKAFIQNGSRVLEKLVATSNGKPIPIHNFSYEELRTATNDFDPHLIIHRNRWYKGYKGYIKDRIAFIKKATCDSAEEVFTDIAITVKVSDHKNVLKLVGCCLETEIVILVYEFAGKGTLRDRFVVSDEPMTRQGRLKMAREIAHATSYLHTAFSRPIIHTNINLDTVFVDQNDIPKLTGFSFSLIIPEGEIHVNDNWKRGMTTLFQCPNYFATGCITEKTDVYCFGWLLLELLTGKRCLDSWQIGPKLNVLSQFRNSPINTIVDPEILAGEGRVGVEQQLQAAMDLAFSCIVEDPIKRPTMVDVTKELRRIERSIP
ncbi:hypothetical protein I3760_08G137800 [Carya illinoinensis]|nr:hypothetical protein I3760_08G137800 [Carya illinoinensis]